jgi:RNA polymerase sigma-70 factor, ECF subfamily
MLRAPRATYDRTVPSSTPRSPGLASALSSRQADVALSDEQLSDEQLSDEQLSAALVTGNPEAGQLLYDRLIRIVEWTVYRVLGRGRNEHEDVVQSAFEQIVISLYHERFARSCSLTSWASAVTSRTALNELRRRRRLQKNLGVAVEVKDHTLTNSQPNVESQALARHELERVRQALGVIHPDHAEVMVLHELNGLELSEIASTLQLSVGAVQSRLWRGRRELRERLERQPGELQ